MAHFRYKAARIDGTLLESSAEGDNETDVRAVLERQGLLVISLEGGRSRTATYARQLVPGGGLPLREFLVFNQEFLALVKAGLPVLRVFDLLAERATRPRFKACLQAVRKEIRGGASISDAMAGFPSVFSELYRASLHSGEQTGNLVEVLQRYIAYLKLMIGVREKVIKALAYPAFLVVVGAAIVAFLLLYVMPTFAEIYSQGKAQLPLPTQMLLAAVDHVRRWLPFILAGTIGFGAVLYQWAKSVRGRAQLERASLRLPLIGDILRKSQIVRLTRTLATILAGGIPLLQALQVTGRAITNRDLSAALGRTADRVREGTSLAASLKAEACVPPLTLEMIDVGETTGALETMLLEVAEFHEGEMDLRLSQLTTWIEPVLLLVMGIIVGGLVIVMYLPIFQLADSL